jgi:hypothetical protein
LAARAVSLLRLLFQMEFTHTLLTSHSVCCIDFAFPLAACAPVAAVAYSRNLSSTFTVARFLYLCVVFFFAANLKPTVFPRRVFRESYEGRAFCVVWRVVSAK